MSNPSINRIKYLFTLDNNGTLRWRNPPRGSVKGGEVGGKDGRVRVDGVRYPLYKIIEFLKTGTFNSINREVNLDHESLLSRYHYDRDTGIFTRRTGLGGCPVGSVAGRLTNNGYITISVCGKIHLAHRLVFLYETGALPVGEVDHINGVRTDNRWINLRDVSHGENCKNIARRVSNKTGVIGVCFDASRGGISFSNIQQR